MNEKRTKEALSTVQKQREDLSVILSEGRKGDINFAFQRLERWKERTIRLLVSTVSVKEARRLEEAHVPGVIVTEIEEHFETTIEAYDSFLLALAAEINNHPDDVLGSPATSEAATQGAIVPIPESSRTVFIVHGHDELNLLRLQKVLRERWDLEPVILSDEPGRGRTIIEKFEDEAPRAAFALVLLTPDDIVSMEGQEYGQARPNVIFELGWFYGRLTRQRVCILFKKGTQIHSDLNGISRIEFEDSVLEKLDELEQELKAAGVA